MKTLKEILEDVWKDPKVRSPLGKTHWYIGENTGAPSIKRNRNIKRIYNRLTKEFSWRK